MSDIRCVVCGEPWNAWGVRHGDMLPWQATLFRAGAGCPSCEGVEPSTPFEPSTLADIENGDEDPMVRLNQIENRAQRPAWREPEPTILYECAACHVVVMDTSAIDAPDVDDDYAQLSVRNPPKCYYRDLAYHVMRNHTADEVRNGVTLCTGDKVCPACEEHCSHCGRGGLCNVLSTDTYDGLATFLPEGHYMCDSAECIDCYSERCSECGERYDDGCACHDSNSDDDDEEHDNGA